MTPVSVNVGIALGSSLGGFAATNMELIDVSRIGGLTAVAASLLTAISYFLERNRRSAAKRIHQAPNRLRG